MSWPDPVKRALAMPNGARFYRCALQLNPYSYQVANAKHAEFQSESEYNEATVAACVQNGIEVVAVTDHARIDASLSLMDRARQAGLIVFPGFEITCKDSVHVVCLFNPGTSRDELTGYLGALGILPGRSGNTANLDTLELLERCANEWQALAIPVHVELPESGLLGRLRGVSRINAWRSRHLLACSISRPLSEVSDDLRAILENKDPNHAREWPPAVIWAKDANGPLGAGDPSASCLIKMSSPTLSGLRQAFLDPDSRIRPSTEIRSEDHLELVALAWEGGFLDGTAVHLNENLNALIGGRGVGKSTIVESVRYALGFEPLGVEAKKAHDGIVNRVLQAGTTVYVLVRSYRPDTREFLVERTVPNSPVVKAADGKVLPLSPRDICSSLEIYGQHEIAELTRQREKQAHLLNRFRSEDPTTKRRHTEIVRELSRSRSTIIARSAQLADMEERLAALPTIEETLKRFEDAGLEAQLREKAHVLREEQLLQAADKVLVPFQEALAELRRNLPIKAERYTDDSARELPHHQIIEGVVPVFQRLEAAIASAATALETAVQNAKEELASIRTAWDGKRGEVEERYTAILRDLQRANVDAQEFVDLRKQLEELRPLTDDADEARRQLDGVRRERQATLVEWEQVKAKRFREISRAAAKISRDLPKNLRISVQHAGDRRQLINVITQAVPGRKSEAISAITTTDEFSLSDFVAACREGAAALQARFGILAAQAERLSQVSEDVLMQMEELDLPPVTTIMLNVGAEGQPPVWQPLDDLSTGQKATAILLLLLLGSDAPLIVDQPEDDLDNRFITEGIVPRMRAAKTTRQFIFATHNANIPVLGDAELIVGLSASGEPGAGNATVLPDHAGAMDDASVCDLVGEVLEGGRQAFEKRRMKYGY